MSKYPLLVDLILVKNLLLLSNSNESIILFDLNMVNFLLIGLIIWKIYKTNNFKGSLNIKNNKN